MKERTVTARTVTAEEISALILNQGVPAELIPAPGEGKHIRVLAVCISGDGISREIIYEVVGDFD